MTNAERVRKARREALSSAVLGWVFALTAGPAVIGFGVRTGHPVMVVPPLVAAALWAWIAVLLTRQARRWARAPESAAGLRDGLIGQRSLDVRRLLGALTVSFVAWLPWKLWVDRAGYAAEPWRAVIGIGGFVLIALFVAWVGRIGARKLEEEIAAVAD